MEVTSEVIHIHNVRVGNGFRRVKVLEEIVSSAELPCPTEEFTFVCQAMKSFVPWPVHLIFPKVEVQNIIVQLFDIIVHSYFTFLTILFCFVFALFVRVINTNRLLLPPHPHKHHHHHKHQTIKSM